MSEVAEQVVETTTAETQQPELIAGLDKETLRAINFGKPLPTPTSQNAESANQNSGAGAQGSQGAAQDSADQGASQTATPVPDYTPFVKEFGFEKFEDFKTEFESLKALKDKPQTAEEKKFANEASKKIHDNLVAGNTKEVLAYLQVQEQLSGYDTMTSDDKLKLQIKFQNPKLNEDAVNYLFQKQYGFDESKFEEGSYEAKMEKLIAEQRKESAASEADEYFSKYKQKIELPEIQKSTPVVDQDYEDFKASTAEVENRANTEIVPAINSVKEADLAMNFKLKDENNQMDFDLSISVTPEDLKKAKEIAFNYNDYLYNSTLGEDGKYSGKNALQLVLKGLFFDKYVLAASRQAVNAERTRVVKEAIPSVGQRDFSPNEPSKLDELKRINFAV